MNTDSGKEDLIARLANRSDRASPADTAAEATLSMLDTFMKRIESAKVLIARELYDITITANPANRGETDERLLRCNAQMQSLQDDFSQVSAAIPAYSRRQAAEAIALLTSAVAATRSRVFPPSRFTFYPDGTPTQTTHDQADSTSTHIIEAALAAKDAPAAAQYDDDAQVDALVASTLARRQPGQHAAPPPTSALAPDLLSAASVPDIAGVSGALIFICGTGARAADSAVCGAPLAAELHEGKAVPSHMLDTYIRWLAHTRARTQGADNSVRAAPLRCVFVREDYGGRDLWLSQLQDCVVCVESPLVALRANDLERVVILTGPVAGSVHAERLQDCLLAVACRQIRIHHAHNVDFSLSAQSNPIVEHSTLCRFWPYTVRYPALREHCAAVQMAVPLLGTDLRAGAGVDADALEWRVCDAAGEDSTTASSFVLPSALVREDDAFWGMTEADERAQPWAAVDDFNWLRTQQSPNWGICVRKHRWAHLDMVRVCSSTQENKS